MENIGQIIGRNLKDLRQKRGFTQAQISELAGISLRHYQGIESGDDWLSRTAFEALATALEVSHGRLVETASRPPPTIPEAIECIAKAHGLQVKVRRRRSTPSPK